MRKLRKKTIWTVNAFNSHITLNGYPYGLFFGYFNLNKTSFSYSGSRLKNKILPKKKEIIRLSTSIYGNTPFNAHARHYPFQRPCTALPLSTPMHSITPFNAHVRHYPFQRPCTALSLSTPMHGISPFKAHARYYHFRG